MTIMVLIASLVSQRAIIAAAAAAAASLRKQFEPIVHSTAWWDDVVPIMGEAQFRREFASLWQSFTYLSVMQKCISALQLLRAT